MTQPNCGVVVHLVHGTWPFGLFGRSTQNKKAWFEDGSGVRKGIEEHVACPIEFCVFPWSGRNSFSARRKAAREFDTYLANAVIDRPDSAHIIVAHSHGGTVAAHTLASRTQSECRIKALICLATPFAYLASRHDKEEGIFFGAAGYAICLMVCITFSFFGSFAELDPWAVFILPLLVPYLLAGAFYWLRSHSLEDVGFRVIDPSIQLFLMRATRDDAALVIGFAQSMHALTEAIYQAFARQGEGQRCAGLLLTAVVGLAFTVAGMNVTEWILADRLRPWHLPLWSVCVVGSVAIIYLAGYALVALSVGFVNLRMWSARVEVDAAPPNTVCWFKSFSDLREIETTSLRHGIYDLSSVQKEIALIAVGIANGKPARFATPLRP